MNCIARFNGDFFFLSNFFPVEIQRNGIVFPTVEHAYQAAKINDPEFQSAIANLLTAGAAKKAGRDIAPRPNWETDREIIMLDLLRTKFSRPDLSDRLLSTAGQYLLEGNYWHDNFWGVCCCPRCLVPGTNRLGKLLMQVRNEIISWEPLPSL